jgi:hemerythrin superfamily protein
MEHDRNIQRDLAVMVGGIAVGLVASRFVPILASASGSIRSRAGQDPFDRLIQDHRIILSTLDDMERHGNGSFARRGALFLRLKRTLAKHAMAEEDVVYPLLHDDIHREEAIKHLYQEHADMKIHLFELERLLKANEDWTDRVRRLRDIIGGHAREEEEVEFPRLREALDKQRTRSLSGQIRREESMVL